MAPERARRPVRRLIAMLATAKVMVWEDGGSELESGEGAQNDGGFGMLELWSSDVSSSLGLVCTSERIESWPCCCPTSTNPSKIENHSKISKFTDESTTGKHQTLKQGSFVLVAASPGHVSEDPDVTFPMSSRGKPPLPRNTCRSPETTVAGPGKPLTNKRQGCSRPSVLEKLPPRDKESSCRRQG